MADIETVPEATRTVDPDQIDLSGDGGVLKKILQEGQGEETPGDGCLVSLHYTGTLTDGTKFDSSLDRNEPFEFGLGKGMVVKAFDLGIASMKKGEKAVLTCASEYAYGKSGSPPNIPPNATLIFELELLNWKPEDVSPNSNGGILRHIITKPKAKKSPGDGANVKVHLLGKFEGRVFDDRELSFDLGEVPEDEVVDGVQKALTHFGRGEKSRLVIKPEFAFGSEGSNKFSIPPNATVEYTVTLIEFEKEVQSWKLNNEESIAQAKLAKEKATGFLKKEKYQLAIKLYEKSNSYLSNCSDEESQKLKAAVFSNMALCHLKLNNTVEVKKAVETVLEIEPNNVKAYYRRGLSFLQAAEPEKALQDFNKVRELEPDNKAALNQLTICKSKIKENNDKQKKFYSNMFTQFGTTEKEPIVETEPQEDVLASCGEWTAEDQARKEAFEDVDKNVVMI